MLAKENYQGREQAYVKHFVLEKYLERLVYKLGYFSKNGITLNYVDGFSGPWNQHASDFSDTSPFIAMKQLDQARENLEKQGRRVLVRCLFIEKDPDAYKRLKGLLRHFPALQVSALHGTFEEHIPDVIRFARVGRDPFAFVFIDPKGWTGYGLQAITPVLQLAPGEVLINFMTKDIKRFIDHEESSARPTFVDLYGDDRFRQQWQGLQLLDREDAIVTEYCRRIRSAGQFGYCASTVILDPKRDRTHYHLVYATRSLHGLVTFREIERAAMNEQHAVRSDAQQRNRVARSGQQELFAAQDVSFASYTKELQDRYESRARDAIRGELQRAGDVVYDDIIAMALGWPMVSEATVKRWLTDWKKRGEIDYRGLRDGERAPKIKRQHRIVRVATSS